ncbi:hypothetical protein RF11_03046 [Thelohanellus kitauei]|uniref:Uncharacterized protein n=1 Tax=Thelohanellus kitauei TaxID=669202 RepID=A0A0C2MNN0_THEKT|nr:hypothetical protein RF11_03046 [Thelohanellus kitauei]
MDGNPVKVDFGPRVRSCNLQVNDYLIRFNSFSHTWTNPRVKKMMNTLSTKFRFRVRVLQTTLFGLSFGLGFIALGAFFESRYHLAYQKNIDDVAKSLNKPIDED